MTIALALSALVALVAGAQSSGQDRVQGVAFLPFENRSDFSGTWDIGPGISQYLSGYLKSQYAVLVVSAPVVNAFREEHHPAPAIDDVKFWREIRRRFGVRYLVTGTVEQFDVSRFKAGAEAIGGYEAYKGETAVTYEVIDIDRLESSGDVLTVVRGDANGSYADRALAWTILGKPTDRTVEFRDLNTLKFGSDEFNRTVIGQACLDVARQFLGTMADKIPGLATRRGQGVGPSIGSDTTSFRFRERIVEGRVVFLEGSDAFIDLGSDDGVREGTVLPVLRPSRTGAATQQVGTVKVVQLRGPHMSQTKIVGSRDSIATSQIVRMRLIE